MDKVINIINKKIEYYQNYINENRNKVLYAIECNLFSSKINVLKELLEEIKIGEKVDRIHKEISDLSEREAQELFAKLTFSHREHTFRGGWESAFRKMNEMKESGE